MSLASMTHGGRSALVELARRVLPGPRVALGPVSRRGQQTVREATVRFAGTTLTVWVRPETTDLNLLRLILRRDSEYRLPPRVQPRVVFDVGANIGVATLYFSVLYPQARIYCFEPLPQNLELLRANTEQLGGRVHVISQGLSDREGTFAYEMSDDPRSFGGGSFCGVGTDRQRRLELALTTAAQAMAELGVNGVDVFKIDTEGSELAVLRGIPEPVRRQAQAFIGELHGVGDWEVCELLSATHAVGVHKGYQRRCFPFIAVRRDLVEA